jgi:penicillin amidase
MIVDFADLDRTATVLSLGQSGDPASPHFLDQWPHWLAGDLLSTPFTPGAVEAARVSELSLDPPKAPA